MGAVTNNKSQATYESILKFVYENKKNAYYFSDILEIGAFVGYFTRVLAKHFDCSYIYAVDVFRPTYDASMKNTYVEWLNGNNQFEVYQRNTQDLTNLITLVCDSRLLDYELFAETDGIQFAYVDGGHDYATVKSDLTLAWYSLVEGGIAVFDDYEHDLPEVTRAIDDGLRELKSVGARFMLWNLDNHMLAIRREP